MRSGQFIIFIQLFISFQFPILWGARRALLILLRFFRSDAISIHALIACYYPRHRTLHVLLRLTALYKKVETIVYKIFMSLIVPMV